MSGIPREDLGAQLCVDACGVGRFRAGLEDYWGAPMEADAWARAALAAARGEPQATLAGLQGCLFGELALNAPLELYVEPAVGDTGVRRVTLAQGATVGLALATLDRFPPEGPEYQDAFPPEDLPAPDALPTTREQARREGWPELYARGPLEFRRIGSLWREPGECTDRLVWLRPRTTLHEDAALDAAALVFATCFYPHWEFERRVGPRFEHARFRVLDRSIRIHQLVHWSDWWLLEAKSDVARDGRAHATRRLFTRDGHLLASTATRARLAVTAGGADT